jgi:hypothetical protein
VGQPHLSSRANAIERFEPIVRAVHHIQDFGLHRQLQAIELKRFVEAKIEAAVRGHAQLVIAGQSRCAESI